ncbi:MAG: hypothetical protein LBE50_07005 [Gallionellaceae bacterium]|jgi:flavin-binding protein dodecin|nr:hypothetical protein [Gallionellaceae bacterium]
MTTNVETLEAEALQLSPQERSELIYRLVTSLETELGNSPGAIASAVKHARDVIEHDQWFRVQVSQALLEADDPNPSWATHDDAQENWSRKRAELVKRAESTA